jgi:hypothetical protein
VQLVGPGPAGRDADAAAALPPDEPGGGAQELVAQRLGSAFARAPVRQSSRSQTSRSHAIVAARVQAWLI